MKSKYRDQVKTSCKDCTFAIYEGDTQTDCEADRITTFKQQGCVEEVYDDEKEFYTISRLCNLSTHSEITLEEAQESTALSFDLFIECSDIKVGQDLEILAKKIDYYEDKLRVYIVHDFNTVNKEQRITMFHLHNAIKAEILSYYNYEFTLHEKIFHSKKSYHCLVDVNNIPDDFLHQMNNLINKDLEKAITSDICGVTFVSNLAYKIYSTNSQKIEYNSNVKEVIAESKERNLHREYNSL